jgi:group I intron endonuclease
MQGIYKISCTQDSRVYIGSSKDIKRRWSEHRKDLNKGNHRNHKLQIDWDAYGDESFIFEILEETEDLITREQFYLDKIVNSCYNISLKVTNPMSNPAVVIKQQNSLNLNGSKRGRQKLNEEQVYEIVALLKQKYTHSYVAKKFNVSTGLIQGIVRGDNWKSVTDITGLPRKQKTISKDDITYIQKLRLEGVSISNIATILGISYTTVRTYINKIKSENNVQNQ